MIGTLLVVWNAAWQYACQLRSGLQYLRPCTALCAITGGAYSGFAECRAGGYAAGLHNRQACSLIHSEHLWRDQKLVEVRHRLEKKIISLGGIFTVLPQLADGLTCSRAANTNNINMQRERFNAKGVYSSFAQTALNLYIIARTKAAAKVAEFIRMFSDDSIPPSGMAPSTGLWEENIPQLYRIIKKMYQNTLKKGKIAIEDTKLPTFMNGGCYA